MRSWWENRSKSNQIIILFSAGIFLYFAIVFLGIFPLVGPEGRGLPKEHDAYGFSKYYVSFFSPYPIWLGILIASYYKKNAIVFSLFIGLFIFAYWYVYTELGHALTFSEFYAGIRYSLSGWGGGLVILPALWLLGFNLGLLLLPDRFRFNLFVLAIIIPIISVALLVLLSSFYPDYGHRTEAKYPVTPLMHAASDGTSEQLKTLLGKASDINAKNIYGTSALMYAALAGKTENIKLLLAAGARVNDQDDKGNTALSLARQQGHDEIAKLLITAGAQERTVP